MGTGQRLAADPGTNQSREGTRTPGETRGLTFKAPGPGINKPYCPPDAGEGMTGVGMPDRATGLVLQPSPLGSRPTGTERGIPNSASTA